MHEINLNKICAFVAELIGVAANGDIEPKIISMPGRVLTVVSAAILTSMISTSNVHFPDNTNGLMHAGDNPHDE
ncbi:hypothetical protein E0I03_03555 [Dickeya dadantii]|uniref:hypothetical protein n=1 Tax=Dickeya dadantii TaxID=204038 RepID=UPI001495C891|nr:hypothetical protein [Dickeya dadantii]NPE50277.1 hypothetical protein [Dickeya dadantii]